MAGGIGDTRMIDMVQLYAYQQWKDRDDQGKYQLVSFHLPLLLITTYVHTHLSIRARPLKQLDPKSETLSDLGSILGILIRQLGCNAIVQLNK